MKSPKQPYFFGQRGTILSGEHPGWTVEFVDDTGESGETGGYYALVYDPNPESAEGYDWWFEAETWIPNFIEDMNWRIAWPATDEPGI
jgi:hypothetical protein